VNKYLKVFWEYWKKFGKVLGKIQTTIILTIIYYLVISPIGIIKKLVSPKKKTLTYWLDIEPKKHTLEEAFKQY